MNIDIDERSHDDLTVESVHETTVTWNSISEVLDLKSSLESASKEAAKWTNSRGENSQSERVNLKRINVDIEGQVEEFVLFDLEYSERVAVIRIDGLPNFVVLEWADEILVLTEKPR